MIQVEFAQRAKDIFEKQEAITGLAVGGSWINNELDEYSDLDLLVITKEKITHDKDKMLGYARLLGHLLSGFTGEHVEEPRLLICLYDDPLLHVDLKFLTIEELAQRVETPTVLLDRTGEIKEILLKSAAHFPYPDYQWIEDRFWIWVHYALLKIGRGEYLETFDFLGFLRMVVLGPLLQIKNGKLPRGVRKVETELNEEDLKELKTTIAAYDRASLVYSLKNAVELYRRLRVSLFSDKVHLQSETENSVMHYFSKIENNSSL